MSMSIRPTILAVLSLSLVACGTPAYEITQPTTLARVPHTHLDQDVRATLDMVVVLPHTDKAEFDLFGTYAAPRPSPTLAGIGTAAIPISVTLQGIETLGAGPFVTHFTIPYIIMPLVIYGAAKQAILNQVHELRDELADQLTRSAGQPVSNTALAHDLYSMMRVVPGLDANVIHETAELPENTDAVLLVKLTEVVVEILDSEAEIETTAMVLLRRVSDGRVLYLREYSYTDRDTLRNWIENDAALWEDYMNFARHYFAKQITAELFEKIDLRHDLYPVSSNSIVRHDADAWQGQATTATPTLAWEYVRLGEDSYPPESVAFGDGDTFYDLEVYDRHRLVYVARHLSDPQHTVEQPLPACRELRWTVRPSFYSGDLVKSGEWMRHYSNVYLNEGYVGSDASENPAYTRGFAVLTTLCEET
jgi:hypothetical protein